MSQSSRPIPAAIKKLVTDGSSREPLGITRARHALLLPVVALSVYPVLNVLSISLRPGNRLRSTDLAIIPADWTVHSYIALFTEEPFLRWMGNSLLVSGTVTATGVALAALGGYAFRRFQFVGRNASMLAVLTTQMFPATMLLLPLYIMIAKLHLVNTFLGLMVFYTATALPFCLWQMKGFIEDGEFVVLVGPSGCGKSTLLRMIAGLEEISAGEIFIDDRLVNEVEPGDRDIAMVFQNYALYPHMTVRQNLSFGLRMRRTPPDLIKQCADEAAEILSIESLLDRRPRELSGGQRQRVAVGRAIVRQPRAFLFDEPLSNLDAKLRVQMRTEIARLHHRLKTTMVYVTHDQVEAMTLGDRIVIMQDGIIQQVDTPMGLYNKPANKFVGGFIGSPAMNFVSGHVANGIFRGASCVLELQHDLADGAAILGIRPENLTLDDGLPAFANATVEVAECMGHETMLYFRIDEAQFVTRLEANVALRAGDEIEISVRPGGWHLFEPHGNQNRLV